MKEKVLDLCIVVERLILWNIRDRRMHWSLNDHKTGCLLRIMITHNPNLLI